MHALLFTIAVMQEKVHQNLINGVEQFDKTSMKHTLTQEKNQLPDPQGICLFTLCFKFFRNVPNN